MPNSDTFKDFSLIDGELKITEYTVVDDGDGKWTGSTGETLAEDVSFEIFIADPTDLKFELDDSASVGDWFVLDEVSAEDGLANDWEPNALQRNSKEIGNGFIGTAQKTSFMLTESQDWIETNGTTEGNPFQSPGIVQTGVVTPDTDYTVSLRYRSTTQLIIDLGGEVEILSPNTGAAKISSLTIHSGAGTDFKIYITGSGQDWFSVDDISLKQYTIVRYSDTDTVLNEVWPCTLEDGNNYLFCIEADRDPLAARNLILFRVHDTGQIVKVAHEDLPWTVRDAFVVGNKFYVVKSEGTGLGHRLYQGDITPTSLVLDDSGIYTIPIGGVSNNFSGGMYIKQYLQYNDTDVVILGRDSINSLVVYTVFDEGELHERTSTVVPTSRIGSFVNQVGEKLLLYVITTTDFWIYDMSNLTVDPVLITNQSGYSFDPAAVVEYTDEVISISENDQITFFSLTEEPEEMFVLDIPSDVREVAGQYMYAYDGTDTDKLDSYLVLSSVGGMDYVKPENPALNVPYHNVAKTPDSRFTIIPTMYDLDREIPTVYGYDPSSGKLGRRVINNLRSCYTNMTLNNSKSGLLISSLYMNNLLRNSVMWLLGIDPEYLDVGDAEEVVEEAYLAGPHVVMKEPPSMILQTDMDLTGNLEDIVDKIGNLTIPAKYLPSTVNDDLVFENSIVKVSYDTSSDLPIARFSGVSGDKDDIQRWWDYIDSVGEESGVYLHNLLDKRVDRVGTPKLSDLQTEINPARFLLHHVLSRGMMLVVVEDTVENRKLSEDIDFRHINTVLPLNTGVIILYTSTS